MPSFEVWASPESAVARTANAHWRDQLDETGFARRLDDVDRIAELGVDAARFPVLWERTAPRDPDDLALSWARERLERLRALGVEPIVTLLHHGSGPRYTDLLDPAFPALFERYAERVARAFPWVQRWNPIHQPATTARLATRLGAWYPFARDERAFGRALVHQTLALQRAVAAIRRVIPDAAFVFSEELLTYAAGDDASTDEATLANERTYLILELVAGRVGAEHPMAAYLRETCAVGRAELAAIRAGATTPSVVAWQHGAHAARMLFTAHDGAPADVPAVYDRDGVPPRIGPPLRAALARTELPAAVDAMHVNASAAERVRWIAQQVEDALAIRAGGGDVRAVGAGAAVGRIAAHAEDGIWTCSPHGAPRATAVADALRALVATGAISGGATLGWWEGPERLLSRVALASAARAGFPEGAHLLEREPASA